MKTKTILIYRFSAMGDVALVAPVVKSVLQQHPTIQIVCVTKPFFTAFFDAHERLKLVGIDTDAYKGFFGLRKLKKELEKNHTPDLVLDVHDVLRTNVLNFFFKLSKIPVFKIDKGRKEKAEWIASKDTSVYLKTSVERYLDVFKKAGYPSSLISGPWLNKTKDIQTFLVENNLLSKQEKWVGIAPFAKHETKIWGLYKIELLIEQLLEDGYKLFLFGGGEEEAVKLNFLAEKYGVIHASRELNFEQEMTFMQALDVIVTMDSSNMHIASLLGVQVVSIWGSTHPALGFAPLGNENNIVQTKEKLSCQPCSVFGNKPCARMDHACMKLIPSDQVYLKIKDLLTNC